MSESEASRFFLKIGIYRSNMIILNIDFQSIMFGDAWSNPLIFTFDAYKNWVEVDGCYLDLDGAFFESYVPVGLNVYNSHFNLTNYQYGVWNDFRWNCYE